MKVKLFILGVDGMSARIVRRHDSLPFFRLLQEKGSYGELRSLVAPGATRPLTGPAWASIYTGCRSEEHGILSGGWLIEHKNFSHIKKVTIWELIQEKYSLGMFGMPMTFPPFILNGWMVSGFPAPSAVAKIVYPPGIAGLFDGDFKLDCADGIVAASWRQGFNDADAMALEDNRLKVFKDIYQAKPTEVVAFGTTLLDRFGHMYPQYPSSLLGRMTSYWGYEKIASPIEQLAAFRALTAVVDRCFLRPDPRLLAAYAHVDRLAGKLLRFLQPESVLVCSDHGFFNYGYPGVGKHDAMGYYCLTWPGVRRGQRTASILDIPRMACQVLGLESHRLGQDAARERYEFDSGEKGEIESRLAALGYIA